MATLIELLNSNEIDEIESIHFYGAPTDVSTKISELTVEKLSRIALTLIKTEYGGKVPECVLSAKAIEILTERAIKKNVALF